MRIINPEMRKIALCMELSDFYEHGIARGLVRFAKSKPDWRLYGYGWMFRSLADIGRWEGDGIIARVEDAQSADRLSKLGLPIVDVAGAYSRPHFRSVTNDDFLTGYQAALHLLGCGFTRFAFLGVAQARWSELRREGFEKCLAQRGTDPAPLPVFERSLAWWEVGIGAKSANAGAEGDAAFGDLESLSAFLSGLKAPTALFACNDTTGLRATELAGRLGLAVPSSLAILGVDNEDILCELAAPSLSSIMLDCEGIGFRAAAALDAILERGGGPPEGSRIAVPPKEVVERESTRIFACADELVAKAVTYIRAHAHEGIDVSDILEVVSASRRSLETRFRTEMGRSLHEEILRAKLIRAKSLLRETDRTVETVAEESGFGSLGRFHEAFKRIEGTAPGEWRRRQGNFQ
jgi:LacI family transcriptional regulator